MSDSIVQQLIENRPDDRPSNFTEVLRRLVEGTAHLIGVEFFQSLVANLAQALDVSTPLLPSLPRRARELGREHFGLRITLQATLNTTSPVLHARMLSPVNCATMKAMFKDGFRWIQR
jgi:hypothetical protein